MLILQVFSLVACRTWHLSQSGPQMPLKSLCLKRCFVCSALDMHCRKIKLSIITVSFLFTQLSAATAPILAIFSEPASSFLGTNIIFLSIVHSKTPFIIYNCSVLIWVETLLLMQGGVGQRISHQITSFLTTRQLTTIWAFQGSSLTRLATP